MSCFLKGTVMKSVLRVSRGPHGARICLNNESSPGFLLSAVNLFSEPARSHTYTSAARSCPILTRSYLLIGKADRRAEGRVKVHQVINSRSKTKTHFTDQCPLSFGPVCRARTPVSQCQSASLFIAKKHCC